MTISYPNETPAYRAARQALLEQEIALRQQTEQVAALRRALPDGGALAQDYLFHDPRNTPTPLSALFRDGQDTLLIYSLMYRPDATAPCPMCISMLDGLAGQVGHIEQRASLAVVAAARPDQLRQVSGQRGWAALRLFSAQGTTYQRDYLAQTADGSQLPMMNVFRKTATGIHHFWGSEAFFAGLPGEPRHIDQIWPLWNVLDLTPAGRGADWHPSLTYDA